MEIPLPYQQAIFVHPFPLREGGERAPVALCREPVSVATSVGPGRAPLGRRTRAGRRDGGGPLYMKPPLKKRTTCRVQQKFNSPKILPSPPQRHLPFPQKIPPLTPPSQPWADPGLFWAKPGPIWVRSGLLGGRNGLFGVDSGFSRVKITPFWAPFSPPRSPFRPGRCAKTSPSTLRTRTHPLHLDFPKSHRIPLYYHK